MRFRNTLLTLLIFALLGGYVYFFEIRNKSGSEESTQSANVPVWELQASEVVQLDVSGPEGRTRLARTNQDAPWELVDPETGARQAADDVRVDRIVSSLASLQATRVFTNTPNLAEYGLDAPAWRAELRQSSGEVKTLQWGDQTPQGSAYYVKKGEEGTVYVISAFTIGDLERLVREPAYPPTPTPTVTPTASVTVTVTITSTITPTEVAVTATPLANQE
ncbi:MAG: DUF4340 domain-containing protein [Anaerolineae bacterium]|nr:DUF4340 domain-containing protein [Anaerolineae bacterium]MDW8098221.1 DUF4340 domain-containing protein [Anaerolineae bacterium]